jgi:hypothetical protein
MPDSKPASGSRSARQSSFAEAAGRK